MKFLHVNQVEIQFAAISNYATKNNKVTRNCQRVKPLRISPEARKSIEKNYMLSFFSH